MQGAHHREVTPQVQEAASRRGPRTRTGKAKANRARDQERIRGPLQGADWRHCRGLSEAHHQTQCT
eukprot:591250-Amphidinium_carterae.1